MKRIGKGLQPFPTLATPGTSKEHDDGNQL